MTFDELYADFVAAQNNRLPDNYFTVKQYATDRGITERVAADELKKIMDAGGILGKKVNVEGHNCWIFWFEEKQ